MLYIYVQYKLIFFSGNIWHHSKITNHCAWIIIFKSGSDRASSSFGYNYHTWMQDIFRAYWGRALKKAHKQNAIWTSSVCKNCPICIRIGENSRNEPFFVPSLHRPRQITDARAMPMNAVLSVYFLLVCVHIFFVLLFFIRSVLVLSANPFFASLC